MGKEIEWIIFYDDESSFSSVDGPPSEAPRDGVQCIAVVDRGCGHYILSEQDWYCWHFEDDCWVPHGWAGMLQYLRKPGVLKIVLEGYAIKGERHYKQRSKARKDPRLPPVTAKPPRQLENTP